MQECDLGRTDQIYYKPYVEVSKISNNIIDFDLQNIAKALEFDGKKTIFSADKIVGKQRDHFLDASRLIKRSFGNKFDCDFQLYNWGVALTADLGLESDRVDLLLLTYGRSTPNRITLTEFESIILKHSNLTTFEKRERRQKWMDLLASFKIQAGRPKLGTTVLTIGKRQIQAILEVNEVLIVFDLTVFVSDLRRNDKYSSRLHSVLIEDPLLSGKRLSRIGRRTLEEKVEDERKRMELFSMRIAEEEDSNHFVDVEDKEQIEIDMKEKIKKATVAKQNNSAARALRMAEKAATRASLKIIQEERQIAAATAAKLLSISVPDCGNNKSSSDGNNRSPGRVEIDIDEHNIATERKEHEELEVIKEQKILESVPCLRESLSDTSDHVHNVKGDGSDVLNLRGDGSDGRNTLTVTTSEPSLFSVTVPQPPLILSESIVNQESFPLHQSFHLPPEQFPEVQTPEEISLTQMKLKLAEHQKVKALEKAKEKQLLLASYKIKR